MTYHPSVSDDLERADFAFESLRKLASDQIARFKSDAATSPDAAKEQRAVAAFQHDFYEMMSEAKGRLASVIALEEMAEGQGVKDPELYAEKMEAYRSQLIDCHTALDNMSDSLSLRCPPWAGLPKLEYDGATDTVDLDEQTREQLRDYADIAREAVSTAFAQQAEAVAKYPEYADGVIEIGYLADTKADETVKAAAENLLKVESRFFDEQPLSGLPTDTMNMRANIRHELNEFATKYELTSRVHLGQKIQLAANPKVKQSSAPLCDDSSLDKRSFAEQAQRTAHTFAVLKLAVTSESGKQKVEEKIGAILRGANELHGFADKASERSLTAEEARAQKSCIARLVVNFEQAGKLVGVESPFQRADFSAALAAEKAPDPKITDIKDSGMKQFGLSDTLGTGVGGIRAANPQGDILGEVSGDAEKAFEDLEDELGKCLAAMRPTVQRAEQDDFARQRREVFNRLAEAQGELGAVLAHGVNYKRTGLGNASELKADVTRLDNALATVQQRLEAFAKDYNCEVTPRAELPRADQQLQEGNFQRGVESDEVEASDYINLHRASLATAQRQARELRDAPDEYPGHAKQRAAIAQKHLEDVRPSNVSGSVSEIRAAVREKIRAFGELWNLATRNLNPFPHYSSVGEGVVSGTAPTKEDGTLDYRAVGGIGLKLAQEYADHAHLAVGASSEQVQEAITRAKEASQMIMTLDNTIRRKGDPGLKSERDIVQVLKPMIADINAAGEAVLGERPFDRKDFAAAHNLRCEQLKRPSPKPERAPKPAREKPSVGSSMSM